MDTPEAAECKASKDNGNNLILYKKGNRNERKPRHKPYPPALPAKSILHLYHKGVAYPYAKEYGIPLKFILLHFESAK